MGSGEVAIVALSTMISLKVTFSDGLGGGGVGCGRKKKGTVSRLSHFLKYTIIYKTTILNHV